MVSKLWRIRAVCHQPHTKPKRSSVDWTEDLECAGHVPWGRVGDDQLSVCHDRPQRPNVDLAVRNSSSDQFVIYAGEATGDWSRDRIIVIAAFNSDLQLHLSRIVRHLSIDRNVVNKKPILLATQQTSAFSIVFGIGDSFFARKVMQIPT